MVSEVLLGFCFALITWSPDYTIYKGPAKNFQLLVSMSGDQRLFGNRVNSVLSTKEFYSHILRNALL